MDREPDNRLWSQVLYCLIKRDYERASARHAAEMPLEAMLQIEDFDLSIGTGPAYCLAKQEPRRFS
jgi:hypothetical protein